MRAANADDGVLDRSSGNILGSLHCFLNRGHGLVELNNDTFARPLGIGHAVSAITQARIGDLGHQCTGLRASDINRRDVASLLVRHSFMRSLTAINWYLLLRNRWTRLRTRRTRRHRR